MVADPTVGKYMVGCLTNLIVFFCERKQKILIIIKLYITQICTLWFCGYLIEWWLSCGHMYVTHTVYKPFRHYILDNIHAKSERKSRFLIQQDCIAICGLLVGFLATKIDHNVH